MSFVWRFVCLAIGDALSSFGVPVFSPTSVTNVGTYTSTVSGLTSANYAITPLGQSVRPRSRCSRPQAARTAA